MNMKRTILTTITLLLAVTLQAQGEQSSEVKRLSNRLYNPDPAPVVSGDRLYVFTGHDLDTATYFRMPDWQLFSTTDMEHWTYHRRVTRFVYHPRWHHRLQGQILSLLSRWHPLWRQWFPSHHRHPRVSATERRSYSENRHPDKIIDVTCLS